MIKIKAHATTANLGVLFDCGGLAIRDLWTVTSFRETPSGLRIEVTGAYAESIPLGQENLAYQAIRTYLSAVGKRLEGIHLVLENHIPPGRGLGSSAACIVSALMAVNRHFQDLLPKRDLLALAAEMEGHGDNACACLYGGFTVYSKLHVLHVPVPNDLRGILLVPGFGVSTADARRILPPSYTAGDMAKALQNASLLACAMVQKDYRTMSIVLEEDVVHEPSRSKLLPGFEDIREKGRQAGSLGTVISGSGSSVVSLCMEKDQDRLYEALCSFPAFHASPITFTNLGAAVI
ncbi:MAG: homoserine kinase [Clostridia bacterium]